MMGLAAYGEPRFAGRVGRIVRTRDADCRLDLDYFTHHAKGVDMTWEAGEPVVGPVFSHRMVEEFGPPREPGSEILDRHADLAASVQAVLEENYFALLRHVARETLATRLCLAGGVALNCAANGKLFAQTPFREVYIQPAAHDAGTSIGAAQYVWHHNFGKPREFTMRHVYYGPSQDGAEVRATLDKAGLNYRELAEDELVRRTAEAIAAGKIVGWFQGRMEFGPRALGNRSILADPRRPGMKDVLNRRIKYREPFRPFCPSILAERVADYFEISQPSPFMVMAFPIKASKRGTVPAITHRDGTGRLQTVERQANPLYWKLLREFERITGVPILLNTSFNENEPIVATPEQALECFLRTDMDLLVIGPCLLLKSENDSSKSERRAFAELEHA
jgi:carbamoyltransferase